MTAMSRRIHPALVVLVLLVGLAAQLSYHALAQSSTQSGGSSVAMFAPSGESTQDWPRWRGPGGQGLAVDSGYPDTWSDKENVLWRAEVPGRGHSSPIVWKDRIFLTTGHDDGRVSVLGFNRADGKQLWETFVPDGRRKHYQKNSHASATPTTDGRASTPRSATRGSWRSTSTASSSGIARSGTFNNYHGTAGSPLLYKDRLIVFQDHRGGSEGGAFVAALDTATGKTLWRTGAAGDGGLEHADCDPRLRSRRDHRQQSEPRPRLQSRYRQGAVDLPRQPLRSDSNARGRPRPGVLLVGARRPDARDQAGRQGRRHRDTRRLAEPEGVAVRALAASLRRLPLSGERHGEHRHRFEATTGKLMWQGRLGVATREGFSASPVGVDGKVFFTNDDGETFVAEGGPDVRVAARERLNARVLASPALVDGRGITAPIAISSP